jgi:hypothetical protein
MADSDTLFIGWCGVLALLGHGQVGASRRGRLAGMALGVTLLVLGNLIDGDRRVMAKYHAVVRAGRRFLSEAFTK